MDVFEFPFALLAFLGFVLVTPAWMYFVSQYPSVSQLSLPSQFLVNMVLPVTASLFLASWLEGGARA
jgi:hypothetical protein